MNRAYHRDTLSSCAVCGDLLTKDGADQWEHTTPPWFEHEPEPGPYNLHPDRNVPDTPRP